MRFEQIQCLEDFDKLVNPNRHEICQYLTSVVFNMIDGIGDTTITAWDGLTTLKFNFFEALYLIAGDRIIILPFISSKLKRMIEDIHNRHEQISDAADHAEQKLNELMDDLDEMLLKEQMKKDSEYLFRIFHKKPFVGA
jgi:hypothetical protein